MKIAVVDDSSSVRIMIGMCLDELDVKEDEINNFECPKDALDAFTRSYYDLILCDLNMPGMNGYELIQAIFETLPHLDSSRIVLVSGEEDVNYKKALKEFGVHHFIKKPIQPPIFLHHVKPLISKIRREEK